MEEAHAQETGANTGSFSKPIKIGEPKLPCTEATEAISLGKKVVGSGLVVRKRKNVR